MFLSNLHTHTSFSDGNGTVEEYIKAAIALGFESLGFSDHSPMSVPNLDHHRFGCAIKADKFEQYINEVNRYKDLYSDKIAMFLGIEEEYFPPMSKALFDYTIGSVHFIKSPRSGELLSIDYTNGELETLIDDFDNNSHSGARMLVEQYYSDVADVALTHTPDILGHFDLIVKLNKNNLYFDTESKWYKTAVFDTLKQIAKTDVVVEINTGGMINGYVDKPYPDSFILKEILALNIPVTISSDCHSPKNLNFYFEESLNLLRSIGFNSIKQFNGNDFFDVKI